MLIDILKIIFYVSFMDVAVVGTGYPEIISLLNDFISLDTKLNFIGFLDDNQKNKSRNLYGYKIIGNLDWIENEKFVSGKLNFQKPSFKRKVTKN